MGGQDKRERALERHRKQREQAVKRVQQRKQQPAQPAQPTPPTPPPQPRVMVLPEFTERANQLGDLIALYLRGDWDYNTGMQLARQYAPNGTRESELRAAVIRAAQIQGKQGNLAIRALVQPEVVDPRVNISDLPKQSALQNIARGLQAPLRSVAAGATQLAGKYNPRGQYGRESGGQPFPAPRSFAESYASDPTFGSALELAFPNTPRWFRVLLGGALDFALDPINLTGTTAFKKVVSTPVRAVGRTRAVEKITQPVQRVAGAVGTRIMHPTAAKSALATGNVNRAHKARVLSEVGKMLEPESRFYSLVRNIGNQLHNINTQLETINRQLRVFDPTIEKYTPHPVEDDFSAIFRRIAPVAGGEQEDIAVGSVIDYLQQKQEMAKQLVQSYRNQLAKITDNSIRKRLERDLDKLENDIQHFANRNELYLDDFQVLADRLIGWSDEGLQQRTFGRDLIRGDEYPEETDIAKFWQSVLENTASAVYRREIEPKQDIVRRVIEGWKRTKTVYNLGTHTRNFAQNFLFHYLTGNISFPELARGIWNFPRLIFRTRQALDESVLPLESAARLGIRARITQPAKFDTLRGAIDDIETRIRGGMRVPLGETSLDAIKRQHGRFGDVLDITNADDVVVYAGSSLDDLPLQAKDLPRNWGDLIRRITIDAWRNILSEKQRAGWRKALTDQAIALYNWGDRLPAMIMESIVRPKDRLENTLTFTLSGTDNIAEEILELSPFERMYRFPFRMEYSAVPETVGLLNIALLPFFNYQYFALRGLTKGLRNNPERIYNILAKPIERSTRITQADDEQGVSQSTRFGFAEREMIPITDTRGLPYSSVYPMDPHFAQPILQPAEWLSRSPLTAIARPIIQNRDNLLGMVSGLAREYTPPSAIHAWYALMGDPQRGLQPTIQHTRAERILRALGYNIQPVDAIRIAQQQQREQQQQQREQLRFDPANIGDLVKRILRRFGI